MSGDCGSVNTGALNIVVHQQQCDRQLTFHYAQVSLYTHTHRTERNDMVCMRTRSKELTGVFSGERRQSHYHNCHLKPPSGRSLMTPRYSIKTLCHHQSLSSEVELRKTKKKKKIL